MYHYQLLKVEIDGTYYVIEDLPGRSVVTLVTSSTDRVIDLLHFRGGRGGENQEEEEQISERERRHYLTI